MDPDPHAMLTCPYNNAHQVESHRFMVHLAKCQKQYPDMGIVKCPFNATHRVPSEKINSHIESCPQRFMMDSLIYRVDSDHRPPVQVVPAPANFACQENWDDEETQAYTPDPANRGTPMYTRIKGATPSERKRYRYLSSIEFSRQQHQLSSSAGPTPSASGQSLPSDGP